MTLEVLPDVPTPAIDGLTLERLTIPVADAAVDEQLQKFADGQKHWDDAGDKVAAIGDLVTMDFVGKTADGRRLSRAAPAPTWRSSWARAG